MFIIIFLLCTSIATAADADATFRNRLKRSVDAFPAQVAISFDLVSASGSTTRHIGVNDADTMISMSTIKLPLAFVALTAQEAGSLDLGKQAFINSSELQRNTYSPLNEIYGAPYSLTLREFLSAAVSRSDNVATDVIVDALGGAAAVTAGLRRMGFAEVTMGSAYRNMKMSDLRANWATARGMNALLITIADSSSIRGTARRWLLDQLITTPTTEKRLKGALPDGTIVAHKTGTYHGNTTPPCQAVNDVGIIFMPNGDMLVCSVFVNNSRRSAAETEAFIANIARMAYNHFRGRAKE